LKAVEAGILVEVRVVLAFIPSTVLVQQKALYEAEDDSLKKQQAVQQS
jgi:hypothetical protein